MTEQFALHFEAFGRPAPQGSKGRGAHGQMVEASRFLPEWRRRVSRAALEAQLGLGWMPAHGAFFEGPVTLGVRFRIERPADSRWDVPAGPPDLDKLLRAVLDACTYAGTYEDDSRVWRLLPAPEKVWATPAAPPGAVVVVTGRRRLIGSDQRKTSTKGKTA